MKILYKNWFVHNMFAHPLSEVAYWLVRPLGKKKAEDFSGVIHDCTIPQGHGVGRG